MDITEPTIASPVSAATQALSLKPLMFETFVCSMAMMSFVALAGPIARLTGLQPWQVGAAMTAAGLAWMLMSRYWGALSDRRGRRPVILIGLSGFALSYFLLSLFVDLALRTAMAPLLVFAGLVAGRGIAGVFYAAVPTSSAALVADHTPPEQRAAAMAAIGASSAAGMVIGPGFAGLVGPINLSLPLYITALLPAIALAVLWRVLPATEHHAPPKTESLRLTDPRLRRAIGVAFAAAFSVAVAQITVGFFALDQLHLNPAGAARASGMALAIVGVALVCAQVVLGKLGWSPERLIRVGGVLAAVGFASVALAVTAPMLWASYALAAFGMGWVYPSVSALAANAVAAHEQGAAAGSVSAAQGLGIIVGPIVGTLLYGVDNRLPYGIVALILCWAVLRSGGDAREKSCGCG